MNQPHLPVLVQASCKAPAIPQPTTPARYLAERGDTADYLSMPAAVQELVSAKVAAMMQVDALVSSGWKVGDALAHTAAGNIGRRGFSASKLALDYAIWARGGQKPAADGSRRGTIYSARDWRIFRPRYNNGDSRAALANQEFRTYVQRLFSDTTRSDATGNALHARLLDAWYAGDDIPGYGNIRTWCAAEGRPVPDGRIRRATDYPAGWSADNLRRLLPTSTAMRSYIQRGEHAAHSHWGDVLLRDRSQLMPFELLTFDDVRFDIRVAMHTPGQAPQIVYPVAIFALDVATGAIVAHGVSASYTRETDGDGGKAGTRRGLQQADMRFLMCNLLERYGLPVDWQMNVLLENASASLSEADKAAFGTLTGIRFDNTGLIRRKLVESDFTEQGGMPWAKGWIEAWFRLLHCRINHLPGTVGRRYDLTPGRSEAQERYALDTIVEALDRGIPLSEVQLPILTMDQFMELLAMYVERLNWRTNHRLQGFAQIYEAETTPGNYLRIDDPRATALVPVGAQLITRREAPLERMARLMAGHRMQPIHPTQLAPLALEKRAVTVRAERVTLNVASISADPLIFRDDASAEALRQWNGRDKALMGFLASDGSCVHLFTADTNTYVCSPRRVGLVDIRDEDALGRRMGAVARGRQELREEVAELLAPREAALSGMRAHNAKLLEASATAQAIESAEQRTVDRRRTAAAALSQDRRDLLPDRQPKAPSQAPTFDPRSIL